MVFPWCYPGGQAPFVKDIKDAGAEKVFNHFIKTNNGRHAGLPDHAEEPSGKERKIGNQIYILDDLRPEGEGEKRVRAGKISRISMHGGRDQIRMQVSISGEWELSLSSYASSFVVQRMSRSMAAGPPTRIRKSGAWDSLSEMVLVPISTPMMVCPRACEKSRQ